MIFVLIIVLSSHVVHSFWATHKGRAQLYELWKDFHRAQKHVHIKQAEETCTVQSQPDEQGVCQAFDVHVNCKNNHFHADCEKWAAEGECDKNHPFMLDECAFSCQSCFLEIAEWRCQRPMAFSPAVSAPGDIRQLIDTMVNNFAEYEPNVLHAKPWVITFEHFLNAEEIQAFLSHDKEYKLSQDAGRRLPDGSFEPIRGAHRTSETVWCTDNCYQRPLILNVMQRIEDLLGVPKENAEYPQILRYIPGQWYNEHHDFVPGHLELPVGPRIFTFFMYLNEVEEGGETEFPKLGIQIKPKPGRAVLWNNVHDGNIYKKQDLTKHLARHVTKGIKHSINLWVHQYNFHYPFEIGCTG